MYSAEGAALLKSGLIGSQLEQVLVRVRPLQEAGVRGGERSLVRLLLALKMLRKRVI